MTKEMELLLCAHCAPTLAGMKSGSLVRVPGEKARLEEAVRYWNELLNHRGVKVRILRADVHCALVYIYRPMKLQADWAQAGVRDFLMRHGYGEDVESNIDRLSCRLEQKREFPHEIGLFLSYPLDDVQGFIDNCGRNYCLCGCWKVYGDKEAAQRCFDRYRKCAEVYVRCYHKGHTLTKLTVAA